MKDILDKLNSTEVTEVIPGDSKSIEEKINKISELFGMGNEFHDLYDALSKTEEGLNKLEQLLFSYEKNLDMLDSLRSLSGADKTSIVNSIIAELGTEYKNVVCSMVKEAITDQAKDAAIDIVSGLLGNNLSTIDTVIDVVLGDAKSLDSIETIMSVSTLKTSAVNAYKESVTVLQSGSYTQQDFANYQNSFNICKELYIKEYEAMLDYVKAGSQEATYLQSELNKLRLMTFDQPLVSTSYSNYSSGSGRGGSAF